MPAPTLQQLLTPQTAYQEKASLLTALQALTTPFPVTDWQEGGVARTLVELFAQGLAVGSQAIANIAAGGFLSLAPGKDSSLGDWLTLLAKQLYNLDRNQATFAQHACVLTAAATSSGYSIQPGQLVEQSTGGLRFINTTGGDLAAGTTLAVTFQAESAGSAYDVGINSITTLLTPLAGVTINNPGTGGTSITQQGTDEESDQSLIARCQARWPSLGSAPTQSVFDLWAKTASTDVTRTLVAPDSTTPGQVDVYLAGASGAVPTGDVAIVQAYIDPRVPLPATCVVSNTENAGIKVTATLYVKNGQQDAALAAATANLTAYVNGVDIKGVVYESDVIEALQSPAGVRNVELATLCLQSSFILTVGDIDLSAISGTPRVASPGTFTLNVVVV